MKPSFAEKYFLIYEKQRKIIDQRLSTALKNRQPSELYEPASYILGSSGKRLRPLLVILSAKAVGGKPKQVYNAAVAVEMLHNFTLVHDDIMDNADLRRGNLTLHKKYNLNTAILAGDSLLAVAYEFLLKDCRVNSREALSAFTHGLVEVCEGQSLDTEFETRKNVSLDEYIEMIRKKTAALAQMCCELGGYLVNGSKQDIKALSDYGKYLGIAFQIQDDLLDITADKVDFGKRIGGDLMEGKKTFLFIKAFEKAKGIEKEDLRKIIVNKGIRSNQIEKYKRLYEKLGVIEDAKYAILTYTNKALNSLENLSNKNEVNIFHWLADSLIKRNK
ncbi:MAG TPA: polyprenyl synthetase family protein [Ignavibacteriaceae bacterium]|nr:polyprenyl synthetase family protein [Ignavibacteriaceae bacterium]